MLKQEYLRYTPAPIQKVFQDYWHQKNGAIAVGGVSDLLPFYGTDVTSMVVHANNVEKSKELVIDQSMKVTVYVPAGAQYHLTVRHQFHDQVTSIEVDFELEEGARCFLEEYFSPLSKEVYRARRLKVTAQKQSVFYHFMNGSSSEGYFRHDLDVCLQGNQSQAVLLGGIKSAGNFIFDMVSSVKHAAPSTESETWYKFNADQNCRIFSSNHVLIEEGCFHAQAKQLVRSLMLSTQAQVNVKPMLDIRCDDVKANHGVTFAELDREEMFYLRSRGISPARVKELLESGFLSEIQYRWEELRA